MTSATPKPRERTVPYYACKHGVQGGCVFCNATEKPRAGEHVPDKITMSIDWCAMFDKEHELTTRLANDLEEAQVNNDANARDATNARAERDLLREREKALVEALDQCSDMLEDAYITNEDAAKAYGITAAVKRARALLAKHGR